VSSVVIQGLIAAYVYGRLTGTVSEHGHRHNSHDTRFTELAAEQDRQWETIGRHGEKISAVEARVQGMEARANRS